MGGAVTLARRMVTVTATVQTSQASSQLLDFPFVDRLFPFGLFEDFEHFFHLFKGFSQLSDDVFDVLNGFVHLRAMLAVGILIVMTLARALILWP